MCSFQEDSVRKVCLKNGKNVFCTRRFSLSLIHIYLELFEEMKGMMQLFETLRESAPDVDTDTAADADCFGTNPDAGYTKAAARTGREKDTAAGQATSAFDSASASLTGTTTFPDNFDPMTFLKGMLSPEQQAMFCLLYTSRCV